jgi:N-acetylglucosamine kinase-like BadF-type ATPase
MRWIFGIDGGGTKSRLRIETPQGQLIGHLEGRSTNLHALGHEAVEAHLTELFAEAYQALSLSAENCAGGFAGSAGIDGTASHNDFLTILQHASRVSAPLACGNDSEPALAGAHLSAEGMLLIAGTGSISLIRTTDGEMYRAGGWGHILGDEGSAYQVAFGAIARSIRSAESRDLPTALLEEALSHFGLTTIDDFLPLVAGAMTEKTVIAGFASRVVALRERGDELAIDLFKIAARELSLLVKSVHSRLGNRLSAPRLAFRGGLIENDAWLAHETAERCRALIPGLEIVEAKADAAQGACLLARSIMSNS